MSKTYKVAVIGSTGKGGYGHGLDKVFKGLDKDIASMDDIDLYGQPFHTLTYKEAIKQKLILFLMNLLSLTSLVTQYKSVP